MITHDLIRHYAKSALNGFDTLDTETAIANAKSALDSILRRLRADIDSPELERKRELDRIYWERVTLEMHDEANRAVTKRPPPL